MSKEVYTYALDKSRVFEVLPRWIAEWHVQSGNCYAKVLEEILFWTKHSGKSILSTNIGNLIDQHSANVPDPVDRHSAKESDKNGVQTYNIDLYQIIRTTSNHFSQTYFLRNPFPPKLG